jgi:hypothetical protein
VPWVKHDGNWFDPVVEKLRPASFNLRGDGLNLADLPDGL